ncbi:GNAT family N-acetyltransferase [Rugosimonospora africana]|uniref:N-acetyltransferase n=1 Tax=Rugosimonospora africana TaxID=556532 RepID=A0A8J3QWS5_9ACTN|nr:GNAT family N-acetyltransferase [Rugosimonospora africana]GIH18574.1 N-acetyltransferase [Rugosimonospora africana]
MDNVSVRPAEPEDLAAVAELRWRWARENGTPPVTTREEFVTAFTEWARDNRGSHRCVVAVRGDVVGGDVVRDNVVGGDVVIGMAWLATVRRVPHPGSLDRISGDVQCVYVVPEQRNGGLGGRLIEAVLAHARDLGVERATVHSSIRAIPAYRRHGFVQSPQLLDVDIAHR